MRIRRPSLERVKELLKYEPHTGSFVRLITVSNNARKVDRAGTINSNGYWQISIDGVLYKASMLAWFYMTGEWPKSIGDHKDRKPYNDKWGNLRLAIKQQNAQNTGVRADSKTGIKGVRRYQSGYRVELKIDGRKKHIGCFNTIEAASAAYAVKAKEHHKEFYFENA